MDLTISERFALISFNGKESEHRTTAKQCVLKALAAAVYLEEKYDSAIDTWNFNEKEIRYAIKKCNKKAMEHRIAEHLENNNLISKVSSLLGCDLYYGKNIKLKVYVSDTKEFECQLDLLKAEFLEEGAISEVGMIMVWLLKEALCFHEVFSVYEQDKIAKRMTELRSESTLAKTLFPIEIRSIWGTVAKGYLRMKSQAAATDTGIGLNFLFPFIDREQSIFIDTKEYFPNAEMRLENVLERVALQGHTCEVLRTGTVPVVKIDNIKYELVPEAVAGRIPIHGVRLRRYNL